jgi:oxaloacetate decarboxylase beta subunit
MAKHLFVPVTVAAYSYLGLTYGGCPYLIRFLVPPKLQGLKMHPQLAAFAVDKLAPPF